MAENKILDFQDMNERFAAEEQANGRVIAETVPTLIIRHGENIRDRYKLDREIQLARDQELARIRMIARGVRSYE